MFPPGCGVSGWGVGCRSGMWGLRDAAPGCEVPGVLPVGCPGGIGGTRGAARGMSELFPGCGVSERDVACPGCSPRGEAPAGQGLWEENAPVKAP